MTDASEEQGHRVILRERVEIEKDSRTRSFSRFWEWHDNNNVGLSHLSMSRANMIIKNAGIRTEECSWGIGVWGNEFAMLFATTNNELKNRIRIIDNKKPEFAKLQKICKEITAESEIMQRSGTPKIMKEGLVTQWHDYVNPEKRWQTIMPFMYHFFDKCRREKRTIIDVAAGMGIEYYFMQNDGFLMHANETQDELQKRGEKYGRDCGYKVRYSPSMYGWHELTEHGLSDMYGGLFATGNSLRMLESTQAQHEVIGQFYDILQEGGTIMIDERNHERLLPYADEINKLGREKSNAELFENLVRITHEPPNPMYHGSNVMAVPYDIDLANNVTTFCYYHNRAGITNLIDAEASENKVQDWSFYHHEKMENLLKKAGFVDIEKYADYDLSKRLESHDDVNDAAMFVYVAKKPKSAN